MDTRFLNSGHQEADNFSIRKKFTFSNKERKELFNPRPFVHLPRPAFKPTYRLPRSQPRREKESLEDYLTNAWKEAEMLAIQNSFHKRDIVHSHKETIALRTVFEDLDNVYDQAVKADKLPDDNQEDSVNSDPFQDTLDTEEDCTKTDAESNEDSIDIGAIQGEFESLDDTYNDYIESAIDIGAVFDYFFERDRPNLNKIPAESCS